MTNKIERPPTSHELIWSATKETGASRKHGPIR